jgi:O-antigen/teichoic acid export membrane protein
MPLILVRALNQHAYGQYRQIFLLVTTACMLLTLGVPQSAFYYFPRERERHGQIVFNIVLYHLAISAAALLVVWLYPQSLVLLLGSEELTAWAPQIALVVFLFVFSSMAETIVTAYQDVKASTFFIVGANLTRTALLTGAVLVCPTIEVILNAAIVQALLQSVAILWNLNRRFPQFWKKLDGSLLREQLAYAVPLGFSGVLAIVQRDIHQFYVSVTFGSAAYAVYAIGCFQLPLIGLIRDSVASVVISRTSEYQQEGRIADIIRLTAQGMRKLSLLAVSHVSDRLGKGVCRPSLHEDVHRQCPAVSTEYAGAVTGDSDYGLHLPRVCGA